jgi:PQQ-dependent dehydrogenase (methanol/ethanol family)
VDAARLRAADSEPGNWMSTGRTWDEQRYSPLTGIDATNVSRLGLAWFADLPTVRGIQATPLVVDGVMYTTSAWSMVFAFDAASGKTLWQYDPQVPRVTAAKGCCDAGNRGPAVWGDKVFVGVYDGRLIALDRQTGKLAWEVWTVDPAQNLTITGAPRVVNGKVIIGNGGADMSGTRGYVTAYDAQTGQQLWRFHTVPGDPAAGFENPAMAMAAKTWTGEWWKQGGGGTAWDAFAFDPALNLLYVGTGNGQPWNRRVRSPEGGDNLFLSSIVALNADTGEYVWHYQTTPGDSWDFTATQHMILADLPIDGRERKVILQAPKNGFFYVLDRATGELISAKPYVDVNWATHIDLATGRPVETPDARYAGENGTLVMPGPGGGHNWHPMAFSPRTGLVYIPATPSAFPYRDAEGVMRRPARVNMAIDMGVFHPPEDIAEEAIDPGPPGELLAWDPVAQKEVWRRAHTAIWNGGILATASDLLFQGASDGSFSAWDAVNGEKLWSFDAQTGVMAAPITYTVDGVQYVAVMAGWGGVMGVHATTLLKGVAKQNRSRVLVFRLDGERTLPPLPAATVAIPDPPAEPGDPAAIALGQALYNRHCQHCHGAGAVGGGLIPDLRYSARATLADWESIVIDGARVAAGMPDYGSFMERAEALAIRDYVIDRAQQRKAQLLAKAAAPETTP